MPEVTRERLAEVLEDIALLLELKGENPFKVRAYRQGAEIVNSFDGDIVQRAREGELKGIKGIGEALQDKLHELASTESSETRGASGRLRAETRTPSACMARRVSRSVSVRWR